MKRLLLIAALCAGCTSQAEIDAARKESAAPDGNVWKFEAVRRSKYKTYLWIEPNEVPE